MNNNEELFARLFDDEGPDGVAYADASLWRGTTTFASATVMSLDAKAESMVVKVAAPSEAFFVYYPLR
ncbi:MAG: hypothetical protein ACOYLR_09690 [Chlorobium sp.]